MKKVYVLLLIILCSINLIYGQTFTEIDAGLQGLELSTASWGDYDSDGDLDFILSGDAGNLVTKLYNNQDSSFTEVNTSMSGVILGSTVWGDYDNDGDLDICVSGAADTVDICRIYRNDEGVFTDINAGLTGIWCSSAAWGDYDNDGDLDLITMGYFWNGEMNYITKIYRNNSGSFTSINTDIIGLAHGSVSWGDYDNDSDLDILINGEYIENATSYYETRIYRNDTGTFTDINAGIIGLSHGSVSWGDYDNDGDLDILLAGYYYDGGSHNISKIYRNDSGMFTDILAGLTGIGYGSSAWGDCNNDGFLDAIISGVTSTETITKIYRNNKDHTFSEIDSGLSGVSYGVAICGDYDNDNDLDILVSGSGISKIFRNETETPNYCPSPPVNLLSNTDGLQVTLSWNKATDIETPQDGLSYNIYIGSTSGTGNYKEPMSNISDGYRKVVSIGNTNLNNSYTIKDLGRGEYYWSVQAIDNTLAGSEFSVEQSFSITIPDAPVATEATNIGLNSFTANWYNSAYAMGYRLDVDDNSDFSSPLTGYNDLDVGTVLTKSVTGLTSGTTYYYRVKAYNSGGYSFNSNVITVQTTPQFTEINVGLIGVSSSSVAWGDYDNDGDLDILLTGYSSSGSISKVYRNDNGTFTDINAGLTGVFDSSVAWGDYDNDGDLDVLLAGYSVSKIYRNENGTFIDINAGFTGGSNISVAWGDYDNDGDLDMLFTGSYVSSIYRNENGTFIDINAGFSGGSNSSVAWGDYDNDGDLDVLFTGGSVSSIYRNDNGAFTEINVGLIGVSFSSVAWGDYDNDGDLDILLTGYISSGSISKVYRNDNGAFTEINAGLTGVDHSSVAWGDYDNDGDLDILLTGYTSSGSISKVYRNDNGAFTEINAGLRWVNNSSVSWGDYDNDGDLDILLTGSSVSKIYRNNSSTTNTAPPAPAGLSAAVIGSSVQFNWEKSTDNETPQDGLSYNIYIGSNSGVGNYKEPMSNISDGYRKIVSLGNTNLNNYYTIKNLAPGEYFWSVQTVDNAFTGSEFSVEHSFSITIPDAPVAAEATNIDLNSFTANWNNSVDAIGYRLDVDDNSDFSSPLTGYDDLNVGNVLTKSVTGLVVGTTYYYRVRAYNASGSSLNSNKIRVNSILFTDIDAGLMGVYDNSVAWGDYDNDGDLDILLTGNTGSVRITKIYRNDNGAFTDINAGLTGVYYSSVAWGDYDNDGDLDILLTGSNTSSSRISKIYRNDNGAFTDINAGLTGVYHSSVAWGDYDNDGDLDILLTGNTGSVRISKIYRNDNGTFADINSGLTGVYYSSVAWGDYDNDGDLDILLTGSDASYNRFSKIYRNDNGTFTDINAGLIGVDFGCVEWGDYDNDGDLDILLTGSYAIGNRISKIYRNDNGTFTDINAGLTGVEYGSVAWGDYDNDGDLDIMFTGSSVSRLYRNDNGTFTDINAELEGFYTFAWGDYDNDGDLDILHISGSVSKIYRNNISVKNTAPQPPAGLSSTITGSSVQLSWDKATDNETLQDGLSYNIYIGSTSGVGDYKEPMSHISNGFRKIVELGNANMNNSYTIKNLVQGEYYWSVQAIDNTFAGSEFSAERYFSIVPDAPVATSATNIGSSNFTANWKNSVGAIGYRLDVDDNSDFSSPLIGYNDLDVGNVLTKSVSGLEASTAYYYRVKAYNSGGSGLSSNVIAVQTTPQFTDINAGLIGVSGNSVAWGDYDNDGNLDILLTGWDASNNSISKIYRNNNGTFTDIGAGLTAVSGGSADWGDYDNDGDLDILLTGYSSFGRISKIYRNDNGTFTDINAGLTGVSESSIHCGDYDNDGDLDILLTGHTVSGYISKVYRNDSGIFTDINAGLTGVYMGSAKWGDYDNDGDLDILLSGYTGSVSISKVYRNDSGIFTKISAGFAEVCYSSADWGDYDNDGDLDILLTGYIGSSVYVSKIYRNNGNGTFTDINANLTGVPFGSVAWGDYDNDGNLDILLTGGFNSKVYRNDNCTFTDIGAGLTAVSGGSADWGDYDNDGDLDILLTGFDASNNHISKIYRNNSIVINTKPSSPSNLSTSFNDSTVTFTWDKATDNETPQNGLSYNFYLGTEPLNGNLNSAMSNTSTGYRKVVAIGNAQQNTSYTLNKALPNGKYYWSVQAIDHAFAGSDFAPEKSFVILSSPQNVQIKHKDDLLKLTWEEVPGAQMYYVYASDDPESEFVNVSKQGTFNGVSWTQTISSVKKFYYVVAVIK